jgi:FkbM family methyltransferase
MLVGKPLKYIYHVAIIFLKIYQLEVGKELKNKIRITWLTVFLLHRYDSKKKVAKILGFKVKFIDFKLLSYLFHEIFLGKEYHFDSDNKSPLIIDCGSNIGMSIIYFKAVYPQSRIIAFEPGEEAYECLENNIKNNNLRHVKAYKAALSSKEGNLDFYYDKNQLGSLTMSTIQARMPMDTRRVKATVLSKYIENEIDFLKIDIEGAELEVIEELSKAKKLSYVKKILIEYHHHITADSDVLSRLLRILEDEGFGYQIEGNNVLPFKPTQFQDILVYAYRK